MLKVSLRSLLSHKLRLVLTAIAIILGVTFVSGTLVLTDTIRNTFEGVLSNVDKGVAVQVKGAVPATATERPLGASLPLPESVLARVQKVSGVADAVGVVERSGVSLLTNGQVVGGTDQRTLLGLNWISNSQLSSFELTSGAPPEAPDDVVINSRTATDGHLVVGQQIQVSFEASAAQTFVISGIATFGGQTSIATEGFALFTLPTAESLLEANDTFDTIDVSAQSGVTDLQLRDRVASALSGTSVQVQTGSQAASQTEQNAVTEINEFIGIPLLVFAFVAVFVGSFMIANTFSILVAQRTQELALLRALGATRGQVFTEVITQAALTGIFASLAGFLLGILVADGLIHLVGSSAKLSVQLNALIVSLLVGTIITVVAASLPARRATRIAPVAALSQAQPEIQPLPAIRIGAGLVLFVGGTGALLQTLFTASATAGPNLEVMGLSILGIFLGTALLAPLLVRPVATVLGWPVRLRGAPGRLAGENARRNPRRTSVTAAALMVGLALVTAVAVLVDSFEASINQAIDGTIRAQLVVLDEGSGGFSPEVASTLRSDPKLADISEIRGSDALVGDIATGVTGLDTSNMGSIFSFSMTSGSASSIDTTDTTIVDSTEAATENVHVGSAVTMTFPDGDRVRMDVGGIYTPDALISGYLVSLNTLNPQLTTVRDADIAVNPAPGVSLSAADASMLNDLRAYPELSGLTKTQYKNLISAGLNAFLNLIYVMLGLAIIIAVVGIVNTLALSVMERTREIGLLRAVGMTRGQTREMVAWESVIIALLGAVLGLAVGSGLGIALVSALHNDGISQTAVPGNNLILYAVAAGLFGIVASIFPAIRASHVDVLRAVTTD
ncbi:MAG: FtsX-like permease family protein [Candidatus Dormibacteria bacterium]|jgi:putative ABC transport system permease protein